MSAWVDKIIVVTGGNSGLGTAISAAFLKRQATVVILSRSGQVGDLENAIPIATDVTNESEIEKAIEQIIERFGKIDVWINNVGKSTRVALEKTSTEDYRSFMDVNFYSAVGCSLKALQHRALCGQQTCFGRFCSPAQNRRSGQRSLFDGHARPYPASRFGNGSLRSR